MVTAGVVVSCPESALATNVDHSIENNHDCIQLRKSMRSRFFHLRTAGVMGCALPFPLGVIWLTFESRHQARRTKNSPQRIRKIKKCVSRLCGRSQMCVCTVDFWHAIKFFYSLPRIQFDLWAFPLLLPLQPFKFLLSPELFGVHYCFVNRITQQILVETP